MRLHDRLFTVDTGVQVSFCDPHSPWQRGSNENTNGLLEQYFPEGTDLGTHDQAHLDNVAACFSSRPRHTLGWNTPAQAYAESVTMTDRERPPFGGIALGEWGAAPCMRNNARTLTTQFTSL